MYTKKRDIAVASSENITPSEHQQSITIWGQNQRNFSEGMAEKPDRDLATSCSARGAFSLLKFGMYFMEVSSTQHTIFFIYFVLRRVFTHNKLKKGNCSPRNVATLQENYLYYTVLPQNVIYSKILRKLLKFQNKFSYISYS